MQIADVQQGPEDRQGDGFKLMQIVVRTQIVGNDMNSNSEFNRRIEEDSKPGFEFGFRLNKEFEIQ